MSHRANQISFMLKYEQILSFVTVSLHRRVLYISDSHNEYKALNIAKNFMQAAKMYFLTDSGREIPYTKVFKPLVDFFVDKCCLLSEIFFPELITPQSILNETSGVQNSIWSIAVTASLARMNSIANAESTKLSIPFTFRTRSLAFNSSKSIYRLSSIYNTPIKGYPRLRVIFIATGSWIAS